MRSTIRWDTASGELDVLAQLWRMLAQLGKSGALAPRKSLSFCRSEGTLVAEKSLHDEHFPFFASLFSPAVSIPIRRISHASSVGCPMLYPSDKFRVPRISAYLSMKATVTPFPLENPNMSEHKNSFIAALCQNVRRPPQGHHHLALRTPTRLDESRAQPPTDHRLNGTCEINPCSQRRCDHEQSGKSFQSGVECCREDQSRCHIDVVRSHGVLSAERNIVCSWINFGDCFVARRNACRSGYRRSGDSLQRRLLQSCSRGQNRGERRVLHPAVLPERLQTDSIECPKRVVVEDWARRLSRQASWNDTDCRVAAGWFASAHRNPAR